MQEHQDQVTDQAARVRRGKLEREQAGQPARVQQRQVNRATPDLLEKLEIQPEQQVTQAQLVMQARPDQEAEEQLAQPVRAAVQQPVRRACRAQVVPLQRAVPGPHLGPAAQVEQAQSRVRVEQAAQAEWPAQVAQQVVPGWLDRPVRGNALWG